MRALVRQVLLMLALVWALVIATLYVASSPGLSHYYLDIDLRQRGGYPEALARGCEPQTSGSLPIVRCPLWVWP
jgi:hypothetical protein